MPPPKPARATHAATTDNTTTAVSTTSTGTGSASFFNSFLSLFGPRTSFAPFEAEIDHGGRALDAVIRPYPLKTAGEPLSFSFDPHTKVFKFEFRNSEALAADDASATEIYLPRYHFGSVPGTTFVVQVSDGTYSYNADEQLLVYKHALLNIPKHTIVIQRQ